MEVTGVLVCRVMLMFEWEEAEADWARLYKTLTSLCGQTLLAGMRTAG